MSLIEIILRAKPYLIESEVINALWIEGSYSTGEFNADSDIDVWLDIIPSEQLRAVNDFRYAISKVVEIRESTKIDFYSKNPKLAKVMFYITGMSDDNRIELDVQEASRDFLFSRREHDITILFDKTGAIKYGN